MFPSPCVGDATGSRGTKGKDRPDEGGLAKTVKMWPTPQRRDGDQRGAQAKRYWNPERSNDLPDAVAARSAGADAGNRGAAIRRMWGTRRVTTNSGIGKDRGDNKSRVEDQVGGQLSPAWVEWLMGLPVGWTELPKESPTESQD